MRIRVQNFTYSSSNRTKLFIPHAISCCSAIFYQKLNSHPCLRIQIFGSNLTKCFQQNVFLYAIHCYEQD